VQGHAVERAGAARPPRSLIAQWTALWPAPNLLSRMSSYALTVRMSVGATCVGPSCIPPVLSRRVGPWKERIQSVLLNLHHEATAGLWLAEGAIQRFVAASETTYADLGLMLKAARTVGSADQLSES
jgi:hypothetical protein